MTTLNVAGGFAPAVPRFAALNSQPMQTTQPMRLIQTAPADSFIRSVRFGEEEGEDKKKE